MANKKHKSVKSLERDLYRVWLSFATVLLLKMVEDTAATRVNDAINQHKQRRYNRNNFQDAEIIE